MSIRGPQALASLEEAMRDIRREEDEISKRVARSAERISKMKEGEAELFRQLAKLRLDPSLQDELSGRISSAEAKARDMLKGHAREVSDAEAVMSTVDAERAKLVDQRAAALARLEEQNRALDDLAKRIGPTLASDPDFVAKRKATEELDHIAEQSMRKTEQAEK
ncbi:MAG: hypothetical protein GX970_09005, partial [Phyllobacteriaceae bacterium]|nr:hypothetical protein [Phyllobacteriaceae bacterium]